MSQPATEQEPQGLEPRVEKLEAQNETMSGKLDAILDKLTSRPAEQEPVTTADPAPDPVDIGEQMRQAVRDVHAETAAAAKKDPPKPEVPPREAGQPARQRLATVLYGKEPKR